ncbi:ELM1/GtrOC1 family putative glycosyltransferase [Cohaesibacter haloalkalitolerans]|uniref:ELM1/GtrOC1 family putative glycosyltransferase n=1 Tax=Cohaesibacter haloalkalitolerans TaxID=1162980 RepID=UPI000E65137F|nr:ELM1/GtrOC1 family putative glycosyltransferase [Cohaesibacter haloalkalitolerans]
MRILVLRDDKPGHYHQSEAVAMALGRLGPVDVEWLTVPQRGLLPQQTVRVLCAKSVLPLSFLEFISLSNRLRPQQKPDLVVSAGGRTLPYLLLLARRYGCQSLFSGSIRNIPADRFTAILHISKSYLRYPNAIVTLKPSPVGRDTSKDLSLGPDFSGSYRALMVGAPTRSHPLSDGDWTALLSFLETNLASRNWVISSSRRTPASWQKDLADLAARHPERLVFRDYAKTGPGEAISVMLDADEIFVTSDSISMVTEAVACRKPVAALVPAASIQSADEKDYYEMLVEKGWLTLIDCSRLSPPMAADAISCLTPMQEDYLLGLGRLLADKLSLLP